MTTIPIQVGPEMFRFDSMQRWVNKAKGWFETAGVRPQDFICIDAKDRVCREGAQFMRAEEDGAYPVIVYRLDEEAT